LFQQGKRLLAAAVSTGQRNTWFLGVERRMVNEMPITESLQRSRRHVLQPIDASCLTRTVRDRNLPFAYQYIVTKEEGPLVRPISIAVGLS
jgi:hypothetical protein